MDIIKRCWTEISLDALTSNLNKIKSLTDNSNVMCVIKANAYGHGDVALACHLETLGVTDFAVAAVNEAVHLRKSGVKGNILVLGGCLDDVFKYVLEYDITLTVFDTCFAKRLSDYALSIGKQANIHIKLNTGMSRVGFDCYTDKDIESAAENIMQIIGLDGVIVKGVFTHFAVSDEESGEQFTRLQLSRVLKVKQILEKNGVNIPLWHTSNGGAIMNYPDCHLDMVRAGITLYGLYEGYGKQTDFTPVLSLKSTITQIRNVDKDTSVSYGRTFVSDTPVRLATVSIGYADGLPRSLSNRGRMMVNNKSADIVGRVCMDQTIINVTDIDCKVGDTVTIIGDGITAGEIAALDNTINYETVCNISSRVPRVYIKDNKVYKVIEYI